MKGHSGATGATGMKGMTGATGATGATGMKGEQGEQGATGATGMKGTQGATGATGASGATGAQGSGVISGSCTCSGAKPNCVPSSACNAAVLDYLFFCDNGLVFVCLNDGSWDYLQDLEGPTGATGAQGQNGQNGANGGTGATGATGGTGLAQVDAEDAKWLNLTLGFSSVSTDVHPACYADVFGQIYLRGHITMSPVPAFGGNLLAILPLGPTGECDCTPGNNDILATSTALAFDRSNLTGVLPDVCIVRLLISRTVAADVNLDGIIDVRDENLVINSDLFEIEPDAPSKCVGPCGRLDVNGDGRVNQLDATSITQSAEAGTNVSCGGVYATAFSCGSTRSAPLTPAVAISLDTVLYFDDDGMVIPGQPFVNQRKRSGLDTIVQRVSYLEERNAILEKRTELLEQSDRSQDEQITQTRKNFHMSTGQSVMLDVFVSIGAVVLCGALVVFAQKFSRRN